MDKRSFVAIALCVVFYLAYTKYLQIRYPDYGKPPAETATSVAPSGTPPGAAASADSGAATPGGTAASIAATGSAADSGTVAKLAPEQLTVETDVAVFRFSQATGGLESIHLKTYKQDAGSAAPAAVTSSPVSVVGVIGADAARPAVPPTFHAERNDRSIKFWREQDGIRITQEFRVPQQGYALDLDVGFTNVGQAPVDLVAGVIAAETVEFKQPSKILGLLPGVPVEVQNVVTTVDGDTERHELHKFCEKGERLQMASAPVQYVGLDKHYFFALLLPKSKTMNLRIEPSLLTKDSCRIAIATYEPQGNLLPGQSVTLAYGGFFGPKDLNVLSAYNESLSHAVNFGVFGFIARPLLYVIQGFNDKIFHNYGLAIIFLTILLKVVFYPLMRASAQSMHKMKKLQPQMKALQEKYKDDRQKLNQELMQFYAKHKINPMKGCLPILPQIPVFFAFYQVLQNAIELRHAPFYGWIHDLSSMDPYLVLPLLLGVAMFVQQKLTPTAGMDKTQEKIMMFMPVIFTVMMLTLPAGMTLYMLTNTVTGITQQRWLNNRMNQQDAGSAVATNIAAHKASKA